MVPNVRRITKDGIENMDLHSCSFAALRQIRLTGEIDSVLAADVCAQLEYLDRDARGPITLYINSPGGSVSDGLAIIDCMSCCVNPVATVCCGIAASMAAVILAMGEAGHRFVSPRSEVMIHQPLGGTHGQASDVELVAKRLLETRRKLIEMLSARTGKPEEAIRQDCDRNYYMSAREAIEYGLADHLFENWL